MTMNIRFKLISGLAMLGLMLGTFSPASAATGTAASGSGKVTCQGDGIVVFAGDFVESSFATKAGVLVHNKPASGSFTISGAGFVKYSAAGNATLYVGAGSGTAKKVKGAKVTLSGADARFEVLGTGRLLARGEGTCTTKSGKTYTWKGDQDVTVNVSQ
jgi:hypothetical protein